MVKLDMWEWSQWKHPRADQFLERLTAMNFADRYEALCRAHAVRGAKVPVALRHSAIAQLDRPLYWSKLSHRYHWREAWRVPSRLPKYSAIGLDLRIDARVELELVFVTPEGHLSGPFTRFYERIRQKTNPHFKHNNPAPRIGQPDELPAILGECFALYDDIANELREDSWWQLTPKPWLEPARVAA